MDKFQLIRIGTVFILLVIIEACCPIALDIFERKDIGVYCESNLECLSACCKSSLCDNSHLCDKNLIFPYVGIGIAGMLILGLAGVYFGYSINKMRKQAKIHQSLSRTNQEENANKKDIDPQQSQLKRSKCSGD